MSKRPYFGPSEAQANADALANRGRTYADPNAASFRIQWDWNRREPRNRNEALKMLRAAYKDEVPYEIHEGPEKLGEGGTPKYTGIFEQYIGSPWADDGKTEIDPETGHKVRQLVAYHLTPFRAALDEWFRDKPLHAVLISHVTIGSQGPMQAAINLGVPAPFAECVAEDTIRKFLRTLSSVKVHLPTEGEAA